MRTYHIYFISGRHNLTRPANSTPKVAFAQTHPSQYPLPRIKVQGRTAAIGHTAQQGPRERVASGLQAHAAQRLIFSRLL